MERKKVKCKKCDRGLAWLTREQIETGNTTKKIERTKCPCCKGKYEDCMSCYIEETYEAEDANV